MLKSSKPFELFPIRSETAFETASDVPQFGIRVAAGSAGRIGCSERKREREREGESLCVSVRVCE